MAAVPAAMAETTPVDEPTVATDVLLLLHVPPLPDAVSVDVSPGYNVVLPLMSPAVELTVTTAVVEQPQLVTV